MNVCGYDDDGQEGRREGRGRRCGGKEKAVEVLRDSSNTVLFLDIPASPKRLAGYASEPPALISSKPSVGASVPEVEVLGRKTPFSLVRRVNCT